MENKELALMENRLQHLQFSKKTKLYLYAAKFLFTKKQTRTQLQVASEYENDIYSTLLRKQIWENNDLSSICYTRYIENNLENNDEKVGFLYNDKLYESNLFTVKKLHFNELVKNIKKFTSESDIICELGCGYGKNLFNLRLSGLTNTLEGYDISNNAITLANKIDSKFNTKIKFGLLDLTKDFSTNIVLDRSTVFTHLSLEQLKYNIKSIIHNLINAGVNQVIHFEHVPELYNKSLKHIMSQIYYYKRDYQSNLYAILMEFEKKQQIKITDTIKFNVGLNPFHEMGVIRWKLKS